MRAILFVLILALLVSGCGQATANTFQKISRETEERDRMEKRLARLESSRQFLIVGLNAAIREKKEALIKENLLLGYLAALDTGSNVTVRIIYLVPSDGEPETAAFDNLKMLLAEVRGWYALQLNGPSFNIGGAVAIEGSRTHQWYLAAMREDRNAIMEEIDNKLPADFAETDVAAVFLEQGGVSIVSFTQDTVLGLGWRRHSFAPAGAFVPLSAKYHPSKRDKYLVIHELGHALGLVHNEKEGEEGSVMRAQAGIEYPYFFFTEEEKESVLKALE